MLIGTLLSPYVFDAIDYYGCYSLAISFNALVTLYFFFVVKEIPKPSSHDKSKVYEKDRPDLKKEGENFEKDLDTSYSASHGKAVNEKHNTGTSGCNYLCTSLKNCFSQIPVLLMIAFTSFMDMVAVVLRKRKGRLQFLIILIISIYALFWFAVEEMLMQYNYLLEAFPGFDGEDMALFSTASYVCSKCF